VKGITRLDIRSPFKPLALAPKLRLTNLQRPIKPKKAVITALTSADGRDLLWDGRQIFQMILK